MEVLVERVDVWAASIKDEPGNLAQLLTSLRESGADLDFILARRAPDRPGNAVVFLTPLRGDAEIAAAATLGFSVTRTVHAVRVEGKNEPGIAAKVASMLAEAGINLRGFSAAVIGSRFIFYIGVDADADAEKVMSVLTAA
jgi:hypothetical protein